MTGDTASRGTGSSPPAADHAPTLSVVIPAHNEAANLGLLLAEVRAALDGRLDYEVVVVDDASSDETPALLARTAATFPRLRPLRHLSQSGQSAALVTGVEAARGAWVATLDGDGQNDPADIPALWDGLARSDNPPQLKMIAGQRRKRQDSWLKRLSSRIANAVRAGLLGDATPDTGCGLKLFERATFLDLPRFDHMHRFLPALVQRAGGAVVSVPVNHRPRGGGRSHYGLHNRLWVGIVDLLGVMWLQRRHRRPSGIEPIAPQE
jgi:dolichol-phosphate mannosyltransferase